MPTHASKIKKSNPPPAKTVLIIDDDAATRKVVEQTLTKAGYAVLSAASGEEGLSMAQKRNPDIIITDVIMPGMDGFMLFKELKRDEDTKNKSVLVLSGRQNIGDTFRRFGADGFLTKPVDTKLLITEIEKLIKK